MTKHITIYGVIIGAVVIGSAIFSLSISGDDTHFAGLEWLGYLIMFVALSMIFIAVKRYRDQELGGVINFKTALLLGLGISGVAGVVYVAAWEVNLMATDYAFAGEYADSIIESEKAEGISDEDLEKLTADMDKFVEDYKNPAFRVPMTFLEIFPVGLVISLISAAILRNRKILPE